MSGHIIEGHWISTSGSTHCPSPDLCDIRANLGETYEGYIRRHCEDHHIDLGTTTSLEDAERNLFLWCLYAAHKFLIGNPTLCPMPYWEIHEFVSNWDFADEDLEYGVPYDERTHTLPPLDKRRPGVAKQKKKVELPRGCQKTSTVAKAWITWRHLRRRFVDDYIYHRAILLSATTTLTRGTMRALYSLWRSNPNIKRLFGRDRAQINGRVIRDGIVTAGSKGQDAITLRWTLEDPYATGMTAQSLLIGGVETEHTGQRADDYCFDDACTKKNTRTHEGREKVKNVFREIDKQLDQWGYLILCDTRKHLDDLSGEIDREPLCQQFHTLHREVEWVDPKTGEEKLYYPVDGTGTERYSRRILDRMIANSAERDYWSEMRNRPVDPAKALFKREHFPIVAVQDAPIEIVAGRGRELTPEEQEVFRREGLHIEAYQHCDPASKEEQSDKGDDSAVVCWRRDRFGGLWITYLSGGQWPSSRVWNENYAAWIWNRSEIIDYEMPASELHIRSSYEHWLAKKNSELQGAGEKAVAPPMHFAHMPKAGKVSRIESLEPWATRGMIHILADAAAPDVIEKFIAQFVGLHVTTHDDFADAASRIVRLLNPITYEQMLEIEVKGASQSRVVDGVLKISIDVDEYRRRQKGAPGNAFGLRGGRKRVA